MSTYAISDLQDYPLEKFKALLDSAGFSSEDELIILGGVIDRGGGFELLRYVMRRENMLLFLGEQEDALLSCAALFKQMSGSDNSRLSVDNLQHYLQHASRGGAALESLCRLNRREPCAADDILDYLMHSCDIGSVYAGGREYLLFHSLLSDEEYDKALSGTMTGEMMCALADERKYVSDDDGCRKELTLVFGHAPTNIFGEAHRGKVIITRDWIDIDVGCSQGFPPALLRLDDLSVFYGE